MENKSLNLPPGTSVQVEVKPWYMSSVVWFNFLSALTLILSLLTPLDILNVYVKNPEQVKQMATTIGLLIAIINIILRFIKTNEPLTIRSN